MPPTLEQMRKFAAWAWVHCANLKGLHKVPMALTPLHPILPASIEVVASST
jgi:hypothetical protein